MHEVVTLQFGQQANYVGTHFWNTQVRSFDALVLVFSLPRLRVCQKNHERSSLFSTSYYPDVPSLTAVFADEEKKNHQFDSFG